MLNLKELLAITLYPIPYSVKVNLLTEGPLLKYKINNLRNFKAYLELAEKHIQLLSSKGVRIIPFFQKNTLKV